MLYIKLQKTPSEIIKGGFGLTEKQTKKSISNLR